MKIIKGLVYTDKQYIEMLEKRINKAIEYMEEKIDGNKFDTTDDVIILYNYIEDLLKILKGEENDNTI